MNDSTSKQQKLINLKDILATGKYGFEKESLRIFDLNIAKSNHPKSLGSKLCNKYITTDFSESQLELITPPLSNNISALEFLENIHHFTSHNINNEILWPFSIPPPIDSENDIIIAKFGSSNLGLFKHVYRNGLANRYGKTMQAISGFHFNYSLPENIWDALSSNTSTADLMTFRSAGYFRMLRNVSRMNWLVLYLFGASPAITTNFITKRDKSFLKIDKDTYYLPYATSLRMSDLGYNNSMRMSLRISSNSLDEYLSDLMLATETKNQDFSSFNHTSQSSSNKQQINANFLQIEDEFYAIARLKSKIISNQRSISKLLKGGVDFLELRSLDLNPFSRIGIDLETIMFLEVFLIYCFFEKKDPIYEDEKRIIEENDLLVSRNGRDPKLFLKKNKSKLSLREWGNIILDGMTPIAEGMNNKHTSYSDMITSIKTKVNNPSLTISGRLIEKIIAHKNGFSGLGEDIADSHKRYYLEIKKSDNPNWTIFEKEAKESLKKQNLLEDNGDQNFDSFIESYFKN